MDEQEHNSPSEGSGASEVSLVDQTTPINAGLAPPTADTSSSLVKSGPTGDSFHPIESEIPRESPQRFVPVCSLNPIDIIKQRKLHLPFTEDVKRKYLENLARSGRKVDSAYGAGTSPTTISTHRKADPEFAELEAEALECFRDRIESEVFERAVVGWEEPIVNMGMVVAHRRVKSDRLLELLSKRHIKEYRDKQELDVNVTGGVLVVGAALKPKDWADQYAGEAPIDQLPSGKE